MASETDKINFPDIIKLNVGGIHYTTYLKTLTQDTECLLGRMFTGKAPVAKDEDGCYFIESDGVVFYNILDFMRGREPVLPSDKFSLERLKNEAKFLEMPKFVTLLSEQISLLYSEEANGGSQENKQPKTLGQIVLDQLKLDGIRSKNSPLEEQSSAPPLSWKPLEADLISDGLQKNTDCLHKNTDCLQKISGVRCFTLLTALYVRTFDKRDPCIQVVRHVSGDFETCREVFGGLIIPDQAFGKFRNKWYLPTSVESTLEASLSAGYRIISTISHAGSTGSYNLFHFAKY